MDLIEAIELRHSVRQYTDQPLDGEQIGALQADIDAFNEASGLRICLMVDHNEAFSSFLARSGGFGGVHNYIAFISPDADVEQEEKIGYYGEYLVLHAQELGLNTCWAAGSFNKKKVKKACAVRPEENLICVAALGYGATQGYPHESKPIDELCRIAGGADSYEDAPDWFKAGMEAAILAPTAMNQQRFVIILEDEHEVSAVATRGFYKDVDLGIVKRHFEIGAGTENFSWRGTHTETAAEESDPEE